MCQGDTDSVTQIGVCSGCGERGIVLIWYHAVRLSLTERRVMTYRELHQACIDKFGSAPTSFLAFRAFVSEQCGGSIYRTLPAIRHMSESGMIRWASRKANAPVLVNPIVEG